MFIDTHCHLTDEYVTAADLDAVIARAADAGVGMLICPTANPDDIAAAIRIAETHDNIFATIGIHPEYSSACATNHITDAIITHPRVVGIGEIGLDYHYGRDERDNQIRLFGEQLDIARRGGIPVAIHTRDAEDDTTAILSETDVRGVMHCFTGTWEFARKMLDRGFYFSASGILTFKNAGDIRDTFAKIPMDRIVIETDTPYCAPVPHRGKPCEPFMVVETARMLAEIKNLQLDELSPILVENTYNLYPKMKK